MSYTEQATPGTWYTITCTAPATVTQQIDGETATLATLTESGTTTFRATASTITVETEGKYHILPTKAPAALCSGGNLTDKQTAELVQLTPAGTSEDNFNSYGFVCVVSRAGKITQLDIECRATGSAEPGGDVPIYVKVWRGTTELLARSTNAQTHAIAATLTYTFEPFEVAQGDELRVTYHTADGLETTSYQMGRMVCQRAVALTTGETGGMLNSAGVYSNTGYTAKYTWHLRILKDTLAAHIDDMSAHVSASEHEGLAELLAHKAELLALLS